MPTAVLRMSCIYGPRQLGTEDQGWVAHFLLARAGRASRSPSMATAARCATCSGRGRGGGLCRAWRRIDRIAGQRVQPGRRPGQRDQPAPSDRPSSTALLGRAPRRALWSHWRPDDQRCYVSDTARVRQALDLPEPRDWRSGVARLLDSYWRPASVRPISAARGPAHPGHARMKVALINPRLAVRAQHLFRLSRATFAARTGLPEALLEARS